MAGVIYFIGDEQGRVKIGFTISLKARLHALQVSAASKLAVLATMVGTKGDEASLHAEFSGQRLSGEWFNLSPSLRERIDQIGRATEDDEVEREADEAEIPYVKKATEWLEKIIWFRMSADGLTRADAARQAAKNNNLPWGLVYGLMYRRPPAMTAGRYTRVQQAFIREAEEFQRHLDRVSAEASVA